MIHTQGKNSDIKKEEPLPYITTWVDLKILC